MISLQNKRAYSQNTLEKQERDEIWALKKKYFITFVACLKDALRL